jgi:GT2 family glycosyltransferase
MRRRGIAGSAENGPFPNLYRARRDIVGNPLVSVLIPFRDKPELLQTCVSSILKKTLYANYEILCIDNGSTQSATHDLINELQRRDKRVRVVRHDVPFNYSEINNFGASQALGEHLLFLNNDTEVIAPEWMGAMLEHSQRPEVGVVGAKLLFDDDTIQHAGVIIGPAGFAGHVHSFIPADDPGYAGRAQMIQNFSAVTFACAMTRKDVFKQVGGLNEIDLCIALNDVDYCLRTREAGYLVVYTPYAVLHHYESKSRGYENTPEKQARFEKEIDYFQKRHAKILMTGDPYYNANFLIDHPFHSENRYINELPL